MMSLNDERKPLPQGSLMQPLAEYFRAHDLEMSPVELIMAFSAHETAEDATWLEKYYRDTDVFIPEIANWTPEGIARWEKVARGDESSAEIVERYIQNVQSQRGHLTRAYSIAKMRMVARYPGKYLCVIDLPAGTELSTVVRAATANLGSGRESRTHFIEMQKKRDKQMLLNLPPALGNLILKHPELSQKKKLKVLIQLGSAHARMYDPLLKRGECVTRVFKDDE